PCGSPAVTLSGIPKGFEIRHEASAVVSQVVASALRRSLAAPPDIFAFKRTRSLAMALAARARTPPDRTAAVAPPACLFPFRLLPIGLEEKGAKSISRRVPGGSRALAVHRQGRHSPTPPSNALDARVRSPLREDDGRIQRRPAGV